MPDGVFGAITFIPRKIYNYTVSINTALEAPLALSEKWSNGEKFASRLFGTCTSTNLFAKGAVDAAQSYACGDKVCFVVSCVGCAADTLGFVANFVPGPNITQVVTLPVSTGCKTFVYLCKSAKLPWRGGCN